MNNTAILVEGLGKQYRIGAKTEAYQSLREALVNAVKEPLRRFRRFNGHQRPAKDLFWALQNVSFEVRQGEAIGIIGRNGAGKSTLLKILSRVTEPTVGRARIYGRVGSLLEVGTGFHPELTGRENIHLSGAVLGMRKVEIQKKFDEIVDFAGVDKFLDTPMKRFSSGMYVRLAFAVAAHLETEILLVDEVLAVGDAEFQKKCLGKMGDVGREGRTVLFVSHSMPSVKSLCSRCLWLDKGMVTCTGPTDEVVTKYLQSLDNGPVVPIGKRVDRRGDGTMHLSDFWIEDQNGRRITTIITGDNLSFCLSYKAERPLDYTRVQIAVYNLGKQRVLFFDSGTNGSLGRLDANGEAQIRCILSGPFPLSRGTYRVNVAALSASGLADHVADAFLLDVLDGASFEKSTAEKPMFVMDCRWEATE